MNTQLTTDVAIIGGGPVGLTLANMLGGYGISTVLLERNTGVVDAPRAAHFDGEILRIFESIGLGDAVADISSPINEMRFEDEAGDVLFTVGFTEGPRLQGWSDANLFHQPQLERVLLEGAARFHSVSILHGQEAMGIDETPTATRIRTAVGLEVTAAYVVACDGAGSSTRHQLGIEWDVIGPAQPWIVVDALLLSGGEELPLGAVQHPWPERPHFFVRNVENLLRWEFRVMPGEDADELSTPPRARELIRPTIDPDDVELMRVAPYTFRSHIAERWSAGRTYLAGDAAHLQPPFMAQGMCSGLRDVAAISWQLRRALDGDERFLEGYEIERRPHARAWIDEATRISELCQIIDETKAAERDALLRETGHALAPILPSLGRSTAFAHAPGEFGILTAQWRLGDGRSIDSIAGRTFAFLHLPTVEPPELPADVTPVTVVGGTAAEYLSSTGAVAALVRPDRYLAGTAASSAELADLLAAFQTATAGGRA